VRNSPTNFQAAIQLAGLHAQMQQTGQALQILDSVVSNPVTTPNAVVGAAQIFMQLGEWAKLETALEQLAKLSPDGPEAWYDLAGFKAGVGKNAEALSALTRAIDLSTRRLQHDPKARDLSNEARQDSRFTALRPTSEFQKLIPPK